MISFQYQYPQTASADVRPLAKILAIQHSHPIYRGISSQCHRMQSDFVHGATVGVQKETPSWHLASLHVPSMDEERVHLMSPLNSQHVELAEVKAVGSSSPPTWVRCCLHSCSCLGTGLETLLWGHDDRRASTPWSVELCDALCEFCGGAPKRPRRFLWAVLSLRIPKHRGLIDITQHTSM